MNILKGRKGNMGTILWAKVFENFAWTCFIYAVGLLVVTIGAWVLSKIAH